MTPRQPAIVPRSKLPALTHELCMFLIDHSTSMAGVKIEMAKQALENLLKTLPYNTYLHLQYDIHFYFFSFGSYSSLLWPQSEEYD